MSDMLYDEDFVVWTERQAEALRVAAREGSNLPLDFENLAEEIESLGRSERREVRSLGIQAIVHILKLACSPAYDLRPEWVGELDEFRQQLALVLDDNPSLRARFDELVAAAAATAFTKAERSFRRHGENDAVEALSVWRQRGISAAEVLTDGLYPEPGSSALAMTLDEN